MKDLSHLSHRLFPYSGPGGPPPYRIYVDSGTVFMCITALAPTCPVVAPFALIYYVVISLMLRWLLIFVYRPRYDGGGNKWPALHEIIISSLVLGQVRSFLDIFFTCFEFLSHGFLLL
jgi:hypothetical protein